MALSLTWALAALYGEKLVQGQITSSELRELQERLVQKKYQNKPQSSNQADVAGDREHNAGEAIKDFVSYIAPFMSERVLFKVTQDCIRLELDNAGMANESFRGAPSLGKEFMAASMKRHMKPNKFFGLLNWVGDFNGQAGLAAAMMPLKEDQRNMLKEILNAITLPDSLCYHYKSLIIPHLSQDGLSGDALTQSVKTHLMFNCIVQVILNELISKYRDTDGEPTLEACLRHLREFDTHEYGDKMLAQIEACLHEPTAEPSHDKGQKAAGDLKKDVDTQLLTPTTRISLEHSLIEAAQHNDIVRVTALLQAGVNSNAADKKGYTALHYAVQKKHLDLIEVLINTPKIDVNARANDSQTPLMLAIETGSTACASALLKASTLKLDDYVGGYTPLLRAVKYKLPGIVELLVRSGADLGAKTQKSGLMPSKTVYDYTKNDAQLSNTIASAKDDLQKRAIAQRSGSLQPQ